MRQAFAAIIAASVLAASGCGGGDTREWMKLDQKYTTEEFRRDHAACSRGRKLDDDCMRSRGWVDVKASRPDTVKEQQGGPSPLPAQRRPIY
jgi:hypothetical protein